MTDTKDKNVRLRQQSKLYGVLFHTYNEQFFSGRLPAYRVRVVHSMPGLIAGETLRKKRLIRLKDGVEKEMQALLLHEMAHAATNQFHAGKWLAEMKRLQELGAEIRPEDLEDTRALSAKVMLDRACLYEIDQPGYTLQQFLRHLAKSGQARSPAEARQLYPRLKGVIRRAKLKARKMQAIITEERFVSPDSGDE